MARPQPGDVSGGLYTIAGDLRDVASRDICADMAKADILIGIYFDAGPSSLNAGSITGYDADRPFATDNLRLATLVQADVLAALNAQGWDIPDDGVVSDTLLGGPALSDAAAAYGHLVLLGPADPGYFSTPSTMPGALIEPLFITDPYEGSLASSALGQQVIAHGLTAAVEQYFGPPKQHAATRPKEARAAQVSCGAQPRESKHPTGAGHGVRLRMVMRHRANDVVGVPFRSSPIAGPPANRREDRFSGKGSAPEGSDPGLLLRPLIPQHPVRSIKEGRPTFWALLDGDCAP